MSRSAKANTAILCLLFGLPFGAVGAFASWLLGTTLYDGWRAREWVKVAARVDGYAGGDIQYRYRVGDQEYSGNRLSVFPLGKDDAISPDLDTRLIDARNTRRPIGVYVNPGAPAESVVDREVQWQVVAFLVPFAFGFGGVGLGALWVLVRTLVGRKPRKARGTVKADGAGKLLQTWVFTFFWNVIAIPIGIFVTLDAIETREWGGLLVLILPLIGLLLILASLAATVGLLRRGGATLQLGSARPGQGAVLQGHIAFPRGVEAGWGFRVKLMCTEGKDAHGAPIVRWSSEQMVSAAASPSGIRLPFRFQVPPKVRRADDDGAEPDYVWRLEAERADKLVAVSYGFDVAMEPATSAALLEPAPAFDDELVPAMAGGPGPGAFDEAAFAEHELTRDQKEVLAAMTPQQRAKIAKLLEMKPLLKKIAIGVAVGFAVLMALPLIVTFFLA